MKKGVGFTPLEMKSLTGFTLVELILTVVILAVSVYGSLTILGGMSRQGSDAERQTLGVEYGRMRMDQILSKRFDEVNGTPSTCSGFSSTLAPEGETPLTYDDVDDYNGFNGEISTDPLYGRGLRTTVTVRYVTPNLVTGNLETGGMSCYKRISVDVVDQKTNSVLVKLRSLATPYK